MDGSAFRFSCEVDFADGAEPLPERHVMTLVAAALYEAGASMDEDIELGVSFVDAARIATLNEEHRDVEGPTDVLSFPMDGLVEPIHPGMPRQLGDVVVCADYVRRQRAQGTTMMPAVPGQEDGDATLEAALERCIVHGVLHLAGFDHERGEAAAHEMFALEQLVLDRVRGACS